MPGEIDQLLVFSGFIEATNIPECEFYLDPGDAAPSEFINC